MELHKLQLHAKWIWCEDNHRENDFVLFRKEFICTALVDKAPAYIGVDTRYWLRLNGKTVVREGGLLRESMPGCGYADCVDLAPYLRQGKNRLEILVWYYGAGGRNNVDSGSAGLIFSCEALQLFSGSNFLCQRHPAYYTPQNLQSARLYGGGNVGFDNRAVLKKFTPATEYENVWGDLYLRPIPLFRYEKPKPYKGRLPYAMWYVVSFEVEGKQGQKVRVRSDRYTVRGGPGDEMHTYNGYLHEFTLKEGRNRLSTISPVFGEEILFDCPVSHVRYTQTGYDCDLLPIKKTGDRLLDALVGKAAHTLYACMRDNFMDCPDRERGQWIGDLSAQMPQVFLLLSDSARLLVQKAIHDFIYLRKGDVLVGNVPGQNFSELPAQSLNAISDFGMIATYVRGTGDTGVYRDCFVPCIRYLQLYQMQPDGLVCHRTGSWDWQDHLYNQDEPVIENAWYYSALHFARQMADTLHNTEYNDFLDTRMAGIRQTFGQKFWNGECYTAGKVVDDRANALAVLCGLCPPENYPAVRSVLLKVFNSSIYMENYVLQALCVMGYKEDAYKRMMSRYYNLAVNENTTLWEDFFILGTKNHAWSGAPATIALTYLYPGK